MPVTPAFAGQWGPEAIISATGAAQIALPVTVKNLDNSNATLYTDRTRTATAANPVSTDARGNLTFWAAPGRYNLNFTVGGSVILPVVVEQDPADLGPLVVNVLSYGAKGDGATDDRAAIQAAFDASPLGSVVEFPVGTYLVSAPLKYQPGRVYRSTTEAGRQQQAVIKLANGANPTAAGGITAVLVPVGWDANATGSASPVEFRGLAIDGNKANNASGQHAGILMYDSFWSKIFECIVYNCKKSAIHLTNLAKDGSTTLAASASENRYIRNKLDSCDGDGVTQIGTSAHQDVDFIGNKVGNMGGKAVNVRNGGGWEIAHNHTYGIQTDGIFVWDGWFGCNVHDNYVEDFGLQNTAAATYRGIYVKGYAGRGVRVANNHVTCTEPTANSSTYNYVEVEGAPASTFTAMAEVVGNAALGVGTAGTRVGFKYVSSVAGGTLRVLRSNHAFNMTTLSQDVATGTLTPVTGV